MLFRIRAEYKDGKKPVANSLSNGSNRAVGREGAGASNLLKRQDGQAHASMDWLQGLARPVSVRPVMPAGDQRLISPY